MDKYEYKVRSEEIKSLIGQGSYAQAAEIADTIDWRRVKSVMMLCTVSDLYKINRRYEDAKNMLLLAYERRPGGRTICYSLCELCIKTEEFVQALNYYKEFVQVAPRDTGRYILQYKLYEAQEVSLEERIGVLEELKKRDYREKWAYELAYLYHRVGLGTRCVEECDELILWFGEGKYVVKAMELKMLHQPLTPAQQAAYDRRFEEPAEELEPEYQEAYGEEASYEEEPVEAGQGDYGWPSEGQEPEGEQESAYGEEPDPAQEQSEELDIQVKTVDVGKYNAINLQAELAAGLQEVLGADGAVEGAAAEGRDGTAAAGAPMPGSGGYQDYGAEEEEIEDSEVFFGATGELEDALPELEEQESFGAVEDEFPEEAAWPEDADDQDLDAASEKGGEEPEAWEEEPEAPEAEDAMGTGEEDMPVGETASQAMEQPGMERAQGALSHTQLPRELSEVLSQEADGQISMVVPESAVVEKQITGQMKIEDILVEWERIKKENEAKCQEEVRQHVLSQTGPMFTEFDATVRDGLLEQLENGEAERVGGAEAGSVPETGQVEPGQAAEQERPKEPEEEPESEAEPSAVEEAEEPEEAEPEAGPEDFGDEGFGEEAFGEEAFGDEGFEDEGFGEEAFGDETFEDTDNVDVYENPEDGGYEDAAGDGAEAEYEVEYEDEPEYIEENADQEDFGYAEAGEALMEEAQAEEVDGAEADAYELEAAAEEEDGYAEEPEYIEEGGYGSEDDDIVEEIEEIQEQIEQAEEGKPDQTGNARLPVERDQAKVRSLTREEKELFAPFIQNRRSREQLVKALDGISMAAYTGNLIITGEEGMDTLTLAKNIMREVRMVDSNFSGKVAKVSGQGLNEKDVARTLEELTNGALIIQKASGMSGGTAGMLHRLLQHERFGIIVVLEDTEKAMKKLFLGTPDLYGDFTARIDLEALSNDSLVAFGRQYAREKEFSIDNLGILALHTRIEELQTIDHVVTVMEVKQIVDEAIRHASRKTLAHFFDVLLAKRYDDEDMIILTEKDFAA